VFWLLQSCVWFVANRNKRYVMVSLDAYHNCCINASVNLCFCWNFFASMLHMCDEFTQFAYYKCIHFRANDQNAYYNIWNNFVKLFSLHWSCIFRIWIYHLLDNQWKWVISSEKYNISLEPLMCGVSWELGVTMHVCSRQSNFLTNMALPRLHFVGDMPKRQ
jgi:hypothetical protein